MRKVIVRGRLDISKEELWDIVLDIKNYPLYFKYIYDVQSPRQVKKGSRWSDMTTILWVPLKVHHQVLKIEKNREIVFELPLPGGGSVLEKLEIGGNGKMTQVNGEIIIDFTNKILDFFVGPVLKKRFEEMLREAFERFDETSRRKKDSRKNI